MRAFLLVLFCILTASITHCIPSSGVLGPSRTCRCYSRLPFPLSHSQQQPVEHVYASTPLSFGPAEICHCLPATSMPATESIEAQYAPHGIMQSTSDHASEPFFVNSHYRKCWYGPSLDITFTLAETGMLSMCDVPLATASKNKIIRVQLNQNEYGCNDFMFTLKNPSSWPKYLGVSMSFVIGGQYTLVASTPKRWGLTRNTITVTARAETSVTGDCKDAFPINSAKVVRNLLVTGLFDGSNAKFRKMESMEAWPLGAYSVPSRPGEVQCVLINNPFCYEDKPHE